MINQSESSISMSHAVNQINGHALSVMDPTVWRIGMMVVSQGQSLHLNPIEIRTVSTYASFPLPNRFLFFPLSWFTLIRYAKWLFMVSEVSLCRKGHHQSIRKKSLPLFSLAPVSTFSSPAGSCSWPLSPGRAKPAQVRVQAGLPTLGSPDRLPVSSDSNVED